MPRLTKISFIALTAVLISAGCKTTPKNLTPLPAAGTPVLTVSSNVTYQPAPPIQDQGPGRPIRNARPPIDNANPLGQQDGTTGNPIDTKTITQTALPPGARSILGEGDRETLRAQTVYFDYDKSAIKSSEKVKVAAVSEYLKSHPDQTLAVEGYCDERGTEEYNRALGERRALSVREMLINLGSSPDRITTVSYGKDKPAESGHDESAWSRNRRGEFVLHAQSASAQ